MPYYGSGINLTGIDTDSIKDDFALLGFKSAANGSLAKYDLVDQTIDDFQDSSGIDTGASSNETLTGGYYTGSGSNMTLISNATTAEAVPTLGDLVMTYTNGAGTATLNTDLKGYISRDNGTTYTVFTLADVGDTGGHTIVTGHDLDISGQPSGTSIRYKIETLNQSGSKETRIQAVSSGWG